MFWFLAILSHFFWSYGFNMSTWQKKLFFLLCIEYKSIFRDTKMRCKNGKSGRGRWLIGSKMNVFQDILNLLHQISMKLWGNVLCMKGMKTNVFGHRPRHAHHLGHIWSQNVHLTKLWGNVLGIKRMKTNEHVRARMAEHVTELISLHSFHTKNIPSKFHQNLMNQIRDILKMV